MYDVDTSEIHAAKSELFDLIDSLTLKVKLDDIRSYKSLSTALDTWKGAGNYIMPYLDADNDYFIGVPFSNTFPEYCEPEF